jgi:hypothetical protein
MRKSLRSIALFTGSLLSLNVFAQQADRFAFAVTDVPEQRSSWNFLRRLDLSSGEFSPIMLNGNDVNAQAFDATTKKLLSPTSDARWGQLANAAFGTGVAAIAYDKKNNRLYYTPMFIDQLRYIDLKSMKVYYITDKPFTGKPEKSSDQGNIVTRMVIASDGNGYAMTNDATQLIRFTTGKKSAVTDLGAIADDQTNNGVSIHNSCSSYGGDMIADDDGNLYVFSARNNVFRINIESKVATYMGVISGLPQGFTVNGVAVNDENKVLVASATQAGSYFVVDMKSLAASPFNLAAVVLQSSDLANSNLLATGNKAGGMETEVLKNKPVQPGNNSISIFPNPVTENRFVIQFCQLEPGAYTIQVTDVTGREVLRQAVNVNIENQIQSIKLKSGSSKGVYLVKVLNTSGKTVFNSKLVLQ